MERSRASNARDVRDEARLNPTWLLSDDGGVQMLRSVALGERPGSFDLALDGGRIARIAPSRSRAPCEWLALPAFANSHAHADRAFAAPARRPGSLADAVKASRAGRATASVEDVRSRARRLFERSVVHGAASIRTHTDVDAATGLRAMEGVLAAVADMRGALDVEIVAFANAGADAARPATRDLLRQAVRLGATHLGAVPAMHEHAGRSIDAVLALAAELGVGVDFHLDEHLDAASSMLERVADATLERGLHTRVDVSHACALSVLDDAAAARILDKMARARMTLIVLPALNLYLPDRAGGPCRRGLPPVHAALRAGVPVRFGTDNVRDWFFPFGDGDPLEAGFIGALAVQLDAGDELIAAICGGRGALREGDSADLVLLPAQSFDDALSRRPGGRVLLRRGRPVPAT
jgi:cytosine deaminase